ncbi:MAG: hypothetical protein JRF32_13215 [Deltaproteobacteria bacterium]|nr:hypothetical protein [Deltaproteobacteria bacterium]
MRIENLRMETAGKLVRATATVKWETSDRPDKDIYIETEAAYAESFSCNPHAFMVGCIIPAMHFGEERLKIDADICPSLREGLDLVMALMHLWSNGAYTPLRIEAGTASLAPFQRIQRQAGLFLSGGFDSLAALRLNRLAYPDSHPGSIKDGYLVHGFDIGGVIERGMKYHVFERAKSALADVAEDAGINLIPVYTNIRHLCDERDLWLDKFFGAVLAAVAHAFVPRSDMVYIGSSYDLPNIHPCGSHPLLDPEFSSYDLKIRHCNLHLSRVEKLKIVAGWDVAFQNFRVCLANVKDRLNCGKCEKCVRTMAGLVAIGKLDQTRAFVEDDLDLDLLSSFNIRIRVREPFYEELIPLLEQQGRNDFVDTLYRMLGKEK